VTPLLRYASFDPLDPDATQYAYRTATHKVVAGTSLCEISDQRLAPENCDCVCEGDSANKTFVFDIAEDPSEYTNLLDDAATPEALLNELRDGAQRAWDALVAGDRSFVMRSAAMAAANKTRLGGGAFLAPWLDELPDAAPAWPFGALPAWRRRVGLPREAPAFDCAAEEN